MELALLDFDNTLTDSKGDLLEKTILDIKKYTENNKICIISNSTFNELNKIKNEHDLDVSFYSLSGLMGILDNELIKSNILKEDLNKIIEKFKDFIYTAWTSNSINSFIYNFQDRLSFFYPKEERKIVKKFSDDVPSITIAINIGCYDEFYQYLDELNLGYEIIAADLKRNIVRIFDKEFERELVFNKIINYFKPEKTIGIGDGIDNLAFINLCDEKVAIKDSILATKIKKTTNLDNNHNGCLDYLINR